MALSNSLLEALTEFTGTEKGSQAEAAVKDYEELTEAYSQGLAPGEDVAYGILARLYGLAGAEASDEGKGADSLSVEKNA